MMSKSLLLDRVRTWAQTNSAWLVHFNSGSCNGCDIEILTTLTPRFDVERLGVKLQGSPRQADVLICTGPVTRQARERRWLVVIGGSAPEDCTGPLRRFGPDFVVLVDTADLQARPGSIQWLECAQIDGLSASTHLLPLSLVGSYLTTELGCGVGVLAIQPAGKDIGARLSPEVNRAGRRLVQVLLALSA
jgi:hydrogenase maturation protease